MSRDLTDGEKDGGHFRLDSHFRQVVRDKIIIISVWDNKEARLTKMKGKHRRPAGIICVGAGRDRAQGP